MSPARRLHNHWPEYLIEAWALGMFMLSAAFFTLLFDHPQSPLQALIGHAGARRALIGLAMGLTAVALIYSPWGKRSGAHMNPAVTFAFWRLGKVAGGDAAFYVAFQFAGGLAGVLLATWIFGQAFTDPPIRSVATQPGSGGFGPAFGAELLISCLMMLTVLLVSNSKRLAHFTGLAAGILVALFIALEAPYSGMSMNPARSFASAAPGGIWNGLWIYFSAPVLGMWLATGVFRLLRGTRGAHCGKLLHPDDVPCIHCGYRPPPAERSRMRQPLRS